MLLSIPTSILLNFLYFIHPGNKSVSSLLQFFMLHLNRKGKLSFSKLLYHWGTGNVFVLLFVKSIDFVCIDASLRE